MDNNEYIDLMRKSSNIVTQVAKIPSIEKRKYKDESDEKKKASEKPDFKPIMDAAMDYINQIDTLEKQKAYITSKQFIDDFNIEEISEKLTRKK